ncbi:MAG TPA: sigma-70 family RNA polymerase sigma factor [Chitinophaga sp.]|uniref:RNA polymerase sigma factor n=1 Tax=Chitinophaga sp. TaxID=1869181 RepID=UPI002C25D770|nr:sigma-70 family RNA polymerase sigma factor [Chitinophaga sp.]HVI44202.1 sigma-70 family RNA polymerase sigma factor [Chitinophaga sp.]
MENHAINHDQERWRAFKAGDKEALAYFFNTFVDSLYQYGLGFTRDDAIIEDTIQDLFIRLWATRERLSVPASAKNYLLKAFRHLLYRKLTDQQKISRQIPEDFFPDMELSVEASRIQSEQQQIRQHKLEKALQQLPPRQKEAIFLRFYENASYEEIARIMETTVRATYKNVFRGLSFLREYMATIAALLLWLLL